MTILVTGAKGMIGSQLVKGLLEAGYSVIGVDRLGEEEHHGSYHLFLVDLADKKRLQELVSDYKVDRIIHLAALAHTDGENNLSWERYKHINIDCAKNVFDAAGQRAVLFISTVDVYGFYDGKKPVNAATQLHPVTNYGKSKAIAECECKKLPHFTIFRLCPVYSESIKRDIQKRYYLKYPSIAYQVGKGTRYEILSIKRAIDAMVIWCSTEPQNNISIIKDSKYMWTPDYIEAERKEGRAQIVLHFPRLLVNVGYIILKFVMGENEKTYLLNKAVYPLRSE